MSTATVRLGDVATFVRGITFKPADVLDGITADAVGCMRTKNVQSKLDETDVWFLPKNFVANKNQVLQEGDLLVSTANSWNLVGKACWVPKLNYECTFGGFISALRATDALVDRRYLYYWFTSAKIQAKLRSFGNKTTNISNLSIKRANDLVIPLPPLAEQKRIAAILDKAAEIKAKREQAIAKLDELAQSTFVEMFGDAALNAENWEVLRLDELVEDGDTINYGVVQPGDDVDVGVPLLRVGDLVSRDFSITSLKKISPSIELQYKRSRIKGNEILISCVGTIGTVVTATADMVGFNIARAVARVPVSNKINKFYLENYLRSKYVQRYFLAELRTVSQPTLNIKQICETKVMCPPIHMQEEYELRVRNIASNLASASNSKLKLDGLIASLQHKAFKTGFNA